jgi:hypothetical protein
VKKSFSLARYSLKSFWILVIRGAAVRRRLGFIQPRIRDPKMDETAQNSETLLLLDTHEFLRNTGRLLFGACELVGEVPPTLLHPPQPSNRVCTTNLAQPVDNTAFLADLLYLKFSFFLLDISVVLGRFEAFRQ